MNKHRPRAWSNRRGQGEAIKWLRAHVGHTGDDCLIWPFCRIPNGYGHFGFEGKVRYAHRFMCALVHGDPPTPRHEVAHSCGNGHGGCVHPKHVSWKTSKENQADKIEHGTNGWSAKREGKRYKLTFEQAEEIRALRGKKPSSEIMKLYGIDQPMISKIWNNKRWTKPRAAAKSSLNSWARDNNGTA